MIQKIKKTGSMIISRVTLTAWRTCTGRRSLLLCLYSLAQAYDGHYHYSEDINDVAGKVDVLPVGQGRSESSRSFET